MPTTIHHRQVLLFMWSYVRSHLGVLLVMLLTSILSTAAVLIQPFFYKWAVDVVTHNSAGNPAALWQASKFIVFGVAMGAIALFLDQASNILLGWVESRIMRTVHVEVFSRVQRLSAGFHVNEFAGATSRKIGRGVDAIEGLMDRIWQNFLPAIILMVGLMIVLMSTAPIIGIAMLTGSLFYAVLMIWLNIKLAAWYSWVDRQDTRVTASLVDTISGNPLVKSFAAEVREDRRHDAVVAEWQRRIWKTWNIATVLFLFQFIFMMGIEGMILLLAVYQWYIGHFTASDFIVIIFYIGQLWNRLLDIGRNMREYLKNAAHCEEMIELAEREFAVADAKGAQSLEVPQGAIEFQAVTFRYEQTTSPIFRDFSVAMKPGEKVALVGHSGGGKSTFVKLLLRLYNLDHGRICIDGQDIAHVTQESLRTAIGHVPQDPILFHRSIAENISYGKPDATLDEIRHAAKLAHAAEFIEVLPKGYDTLVGERGIKLSGGERQRVAIARAILADKPILVLDEATSSLDSISEQYIQDALQHLMEGRTSIVIAHRLSTIKSADRILVIDAGAIIEQGSHAELLQRENGMYRQLYELQAGGFIGE